MKKTLLLSITFLLLLVGCGKKEEPIKDIARHGPVVTMRIKDYGEMEIQLYPETAPNTVNNFLTLIKEGYYDGLKFHRVVPGFVIQGGDPQGNGTGGPGHLIKGEFSNNGFTNDLKHTKGVISMARSSDPDSAGSQFFIMFDDADFLDGDYAAFGIVTDGLDLLSKLEKVQIGEMDFPVEDIIIEEMTYELNGYELIEPEIIR